MSKVSTADLLKMLEEIEKTPSPNLDGLNAYQTGMLLGYQRGMTRLARAVIAFLKDEKKLFAPGCPVRILLGPYAGREGTLYRTYAGILDDFATVHMEHDLEAEIPLGNLEIL